MMDSLTELYIRAARAPQQLTPDDFTELRRACRDYPASAIAPALLLKYDDAHLTDQERNDFRARVALVSGDRRALVTFIDPSGRDFAHFYPGDDIDLTPTTENAIDTFLETYGHQSPEEDALLERMIFNPVPDYAETLARETPATEHDDAPVGSQESLIDAFLAANPATTPLPDADGEEVEVPIEPPTQPVTPPPYDPAKCKATERAEKAQKTKTPSESSLLSESLAKIFIKQGRYQRAYEIISNLSLNYPEKSVYFAVQLRFLQKLIINQQYAESKNE